MSGSDWESKLDANHRLVMAQTSAIKTYSADYIDPGEALVYEAAAREVEGEPILDLGVGGGRTVASLRRISRRYAAIDYTPAMVEATRRRYPDLDVRVGDARDLPDLASDSFGLVVFSCAGIDMVGPLDRVRILGEVLRLLRPGGLFAFSTHSWEYRRLHGRPPLITLPPEGVRRPLRLLRRLAGELSRMPIRIRNQRRAGRLEVRSSEWAVLNSQYHEFSTLMHYISLREQRAQLERAGFESDARAATTEGQWVPGQSLDSTRIVHLLARKPAKPA